MIVKIFTLLYSVALHDYHITAANSVDHSHSSWEKVDVMEDAM
jgi:hypothetical protein